MMRRLRKNSLTAGILLVLSLMAGKGEPVVTDSMRLADDFVTASMLVMTPGEEGYSALGHCALRMECPTFKLDYCFSFESDKGSPADNYFSYFTGQTPAGFLAIPTQDFLRIYTAEGRGIKQYPLNLTPHEKQELWRYLDNDMVEGSHRKFNFVQNNCASMALIAVERALEAEKLVVDPWPEPFNLNNGKGIRYLTRENPWLKFVLTTIVGSEADATWANEYRLSPELMGDVLQRARIQSLETGATRPLLAGNGKVIATQRLFPKASCLTPTLLFGLLLLFVIAVTVAEWKGRGRRVAVITDGILFSGQTLIGIVLLFMTTKTCLFGLHWNWYLIPFNPLPALLWLILRHRKGYPRLYALYAVVLAAFALFSPILTTQGDLPHSLLILALAVRCAGCYYQTKYVQK